MPLTERATTLFSELDSLPLEEKIKAINNIKMALKKHSPFSEEPVDCVLWVKGEKVTANNYNPNNVAPPEMKLLELSIREDGYTQPIVTWGKDDETHEVVDGFHRHQIGKHCSPINKKLHGYLPVVAINQDREDRSDRMASTIRHNRARGKHSTDILSDIIVELKKLNKSDAWIAKHFGMEPDEILRLCQVSGLASLFANKEFSQSWDIQFEYDQKDDHYPSRKRTR